jgi:hypothetical protein
VRTYKRVDIHLTTLLTLELDGGKWSASCLTDSDVCERAPSTHWMGGWIGLRTGLDTGEGKNHRGIGIL